MMQTNSNTYKIIIYCSKFPTLKNAKQIALNANTNRPFITSSKDWGEFKKIATLQINSWKAGCKYPLPFKRCSIETVCFFPDMKNHDPDGIHSGILDLLKVTRKRNSKTGTVTETGCRVIFDDDWKYLRPQLIDAGLDRKNPRIEVTITPIEDLSIRTK